MVYKSVPDRRYNVGGDLGAKTMNYFSLLVLFFVWRRSVAIALRRLVEKSRRAAISPTRGIHNGFDITIGVGDA